MDLKYDIVSQLIENLREELQAKIGSIRCPKTGETPTIVLLGSSLDDLRVQIEGSEELRNLVIERLGINVTAAESTVSKAKSLRVFICYGSEDRAVAQQIAERLHAHGIDTWWDEWEIRSGDSLRRKIDEGLEGCSHFLALLSPRSIDKPWVNSEMDAAFVMKLENQCVFLPIRLDLEINQLRPTLRGLHSPKVNGLLDGFDQIESDIRGLTKKRPVVPSADQSALPANTGYSPAATVLAKWFVENSEKGQWGDPQTNFEDLAEVTGLTKDDVTDAIHELRDFVKDHHYYVAPTQYLFSEFDQHWKPWVPSNDALEIATNLVNTIGFPTATDEIALRMGWDVRRMNPAASWLIRRGLVEESDSISSEYVSIFLRKTDDTRRFVKSRSLS